MWMNGARQRISELAKDSGRRGRGFIGRDRMFAHNMYEIETLMEVTPVVSIVV